MHRGKAIQPDRDCEYCGKQLPALRHPKAEYCDTICRGRARYARDNDKPGIKCLDCGRIFRRVGSHVVQAHGYESTLEYRREHGLMARETRVDEHAANMRSKVTALGNLGHGAERRYKKGGDHGEKVKEFWQNREQKLGSRKRKFKELGGN